MSLLSVSAIENTGSPTTNIVLGTDGSITFALPSLTTAPAPVQTGTLWYDTTGVSGTTGVVIWTGSAWAGVGGGGGGGTVTGVTGTAPIVSSGGSAPAISITPATSGAAGSMSAADKAKLDGAATIVSAVTGTLPITVATGTSTPVIAINAATNAAAGSIEIATLAEAATGTDATRASTPETSVPKDASGMTGAAILPSGTDLQRAAITTPVVGMQRFNTDSGFEEIYTGATLGWQQLAFSIAPATLTDVTLSGATSLAPSYYCKNFTVSSGATLTCDSQGTYIRATGNVTINASTWTLVGVGGAQGYFDNLSLSSSGYGLGGGLVGGTVVTGSTRPYYVLAQLGGSSGSSGTQASGGATNQSGGAAGGYLVIIADGNITFSGAVTVDCSGGDSVSPGAVGGGGGGGSGGCIILSSSKVITTPATVTLDVSGGNGANGVTIGSPGAGGGGGGGGWIILQSASLVDSSTKNIAGGSAGAASGGGSVYGGGGGGAYAGSGGNGGQTGLSASAGGTGVFVTGYYPS